MRSSPTGTLVLAQGRLGHTVSSKRHSVDDSILWIAELNAAGLWALPSVLCGSLGVQKASFGIHDAPNRRGRAQRFEGLGALQHDVMINMPNQIHLMAYNPLQWRRMLLVGGKQSTT